MPRESRRRVVVVGHGMVAHRFCERLAELDVQRRHHVTVLGEEPRAAYDRVHLSEFFSGRGAEELALASRETYASLGIDLRLGRRVVEIDRAQRRVVVEGRRHGYRQSIVFANARGCPTIGRW